MVRVPSALCLALAVLSGCQAGVLVGTGDDPDPPPSSPTPQFGHDGLSTNGLSHNRLSLNRLSLNALSQNRIDLAESGLEATPEGRELLTYIVRCALPEGEGLTTFVDGLPYYFPGLLGFAPEWMESQCNNSCQRWVSACLLAHVNALGVSVPISIRAVNATYIQTSAEEVQEFWVQEGAFWGNIFGETPEMYSCIGRTTFVTDLEDQSTSWLSKRLCATWSAEERCGFDAEGPCFARDNRPPACTGTGTGAEGTELYSGCVDENTQGPVYDEVVTVYLKP